MCIKALYNFEGTCKGRTHKQEGKMQSLTWKSLDGRNQWSSLRHCLESSHYKIKLYLWKYYGPNLLRSSSGVRAVLVLSDCYSGSVVPGYCVLCPPSFMLSLSSSSKEVGDVAHSRSLGNAEGVEEWYEFQLSNSCLISRACKGSDITWRLPSTPSFSLNCFPSCIAVILYLQVRIHRGTFGDAVYWVLPHQRALPQNSKELATKQALERLILPKDVPVRTSGSFC